MNNTHRGEHHTRTLESGLEVHLVRAPNSTNWLIKSLSANQVSQNGSFATKTWFAKGLGIGERLFGSTESAYAFVEKHARLSSIPETA